MPKEKFDPHHASNFPKEKNLQTPLGTHKALDNLYGAQEQSSRSNSLLRVPEGYSGPAFFKSENGLFPVKIVAYWPEKDDFDKRPHVSAMLDVPEGEYRLDPPMPAEYVGVELSALRLFKAEQKRKRKSEKMRKICHLISKAV